MSKIYGPQELGVRMHQWHSGMDAVYGVGSYFFAGMGVTEERLDDAIDILKGVYSRRKQSRMPAADARQLSALIRDLKALKAGNYLDPDDLRDNPGCGCASTRPSRGARGRRPRSNPAKVPQRVQAILRMGKREGVTPAQAMALHRRMTEVERQGGSHNDIDAILDDVNDAIRANGIESITGDWHDRYYQNIVALYVNMGDTYDTTILYDATRNRFYATSWGDWVERDGDRLGVQ
jgi:hypothetical protein